MSTTKSYAIDKWRVYEAYLAIKANAGAAGVDKQTIEYFEKDLKDNLYKIWNRMSSGCYFPPAVKAVPIPKKSGGQRILGIPTVADRIAQMVVKMQIEPELEAKFLADSYGYRPGKSALDAVGITRARCWQYDWVLEFDIKGLFDNIDHELLLRALEKDVRCDWATLYIKRWLMAPMQGVDGTQIERNRGTPQGGVISPLLANLFLHYVFDVWMGKHYPNNPWCRYADDGLVHCRTEQEALAIRAALDGRFSECQLQMHPDKTKIVYCKDGKRRRNYPVIKFDFLGYTFRPRKVKSKKYRGLFVSFTPAVSQQALKSMRQTTRRLSYRNLTELSLTDIAKRHNPILRGWLAYYGKFRRSAMHTIFRHFDETLKAWAMKKYRKLKYCKTCATKFLERIEKKHPRLFVHWQERLAHRIA